MREGDALQLPAAEVADIVRELSRVKKGARGKLAPSSHIQVRLVGSSNQCGSFLVEAADRRLKCYECLTPRRAWLVQQLTRALRSEGVRLPECLAVRGRVVFAEWVDGEPITSLSEREKLELMAAYQAGIHGGTIPREIRRPTAMPHLQWLFARLRQFAGTLVDEQFLQRLYDRLIELRPRAAPAGILHSDLIATNLVVAGSGVISVDNEFLCAGYGQEWDILNTAKVSFPNRRGLQQRYFETYAKYRSLHTLLSDHDYWQAVYDVKMAGKRLSEGLGDDGLGYLNAAAERTGCRRG